MTLLVATITLVVIVFIYDIKLQNARERLLMFEDENADLDNEITDLKNQIEFYKNQKHEA